MRSQSLPLSNHRFRESSTQTTLPFRPTKQVWKQRTRNQRGFVITASDARFTKESESPASPTTWDRILKKLRQNQVQSISSDDLITYKKNGMQIIDIRPTKEYEAGFIEDSINIPLYDMIEGWSARKIVTRIGFAAFGVLDGTELKKDFFEQIEGLVDKEKGVVIVCGLGETYVMEGNQKRILPSRSMIAAHELSCNGYKNVKVLRPGTRGWEEEGRELLMYADEEP